MKKNGLYSITAITMAVLLVFSITSNAQEDFFDDTGDFMDSGAQRLERRVLIDAITAGMLPRASFDFDIRTFSQGGVQAGVNVGLMNRINIGLSFGGARILSEQNTEWNSDMEFLLKYRIITEDYSYPSIAFGFSSQGSGYWDKDKKRYAQKSKGFFIAATKSFLAYQNVVAFTGGINITPEGWSENKNPTAYFGFITQVNNEVHFLGEYDFAINDNKRYAQYGRGRGNLNFGLEWVLTESVSLEFNLRNVLLNRDDVKSPERGIRLIYLESF